MTAPKVSVVMPVRNEQETVADTLKSVLTQSEVDLEFIVVDDESSDGTAAILDEWSGRDERLKVIRGSGGLTMALIAGCKAARGELIARQDCGDISLPGRFATEAGSFVENPEVGLVCCSTEYVGPEGDHLFTSNGNCETSRKTRIAPVQGDSTRFVGPSHHGAAMFRRSAYLDSGGYRPEFASGQDWDLWYRMSPRWMFQLIPEVGYRATIRPRGVSFSRRREQDAFAELSREAWRRRERGESESELLERAADLSDRFCRQSTGSVDESSGWYFLGECLRRQGNPRASEYLRRAAMAKPTLWKAWLRWAQSLAMPRSGP